MNRILVLGQDLRERSKFLESIWQKAENFASVVGICATLIGWIVSVLALLLASMFQLEPMILDVVYKVCEAVSGLGTLLLLFSLIDTCDFKAASSWIPAMFFLGMLGISTTHSFLVMASGNMFSVWLILVSIVAHVMYAVCAVAVGGVLSGIIEKYAPNWLFESMLSSGLFLLFIGTATTAIELANPNIQFVFWCVNPQGILAMGAFLFIGAFTWIAGWYNTENSAVEYALLMLMVLTLLHSGVMRVFAVNDALNLYSLIAYAVEVVLAFAIGQFVPAKRDNLEVE